MEVWQTSDLRQLRLGEEKKERKKKNKPQHENIMVCPIPYGDDNERDKEQNTLALIGPSFPIDKQKFN